MPMLQQFPRAPHRWFWLAIAFCTLLVLLCTVPYHFPVSPTESASYAFGYSNRIAVALFAVYTLLVLLVGPSLPAIEARPPQDALSPRRCICPNRHRSALHLLLPAHTQTRRL